MKTTLLWILVFVLAGAAAFGFYKALDLTQKNAALGFALAETHEKLTAAQGELATVQGRLSDMLVLKDQLTDEVVLLKGQVEDRDKKIVKYQQYARLAKERIQDVAEANMMFAGRHREMSERMLRLTLENKELKHQLSSPDGLKQALRDLKRRRARPESSPRRPRTRLVPSAKTRVPARVEAKVTDAAENSDGNGGYLTRAGRSTFLGFVDIQVRPAELLSIEP